MIEHFSGLYRIIDPEVVGQRRPDILRGMQDDDSDELPNQEELDDEILSTEVLPVSLLLEICRRHRKAFYKDPEGQA